MRVKIFTFCRDRCPYLFPKRGHPSTPHKKSTSIGLLQSRRQNPLLLLSFVLSSFLVTSCKDISSSESEPATAKTYFPLQVGSTSLQAQLAIHLHELQQGLMFRTHMDTDHGMLFVFKNPQKQSFYMRNTKIPLHIGYFTSDGTLKEIYLMYPEDETPIKSISSSIQFALEMNKGWFANNQVSPGAKLDLDAVQKAFEARGIDGTLYFSDSDQAK
ncbi:MAG: DUF192 domain-containing protein [Opitutaceae bacterium]|nr:DUF192 domain-containing protein [Opitutaceae bacterium]